MKVHSFRLARRIVSGRRALAGLTGATAALSLLILSLTPHPGPDPRVGGQSVLSHGHQRRIQQEAAGVEDYGEPRRGGYNGSRGADDPLLSEVKVKTVKEEVEAEVEAVVEEEEEAEVVKAKVVDIPKEARAEGAEEEAEDDDRQILSKARETAITALQHGFKLTEGQKRLLERMSPTERQEVESKVSKIRALQEKVYLQQLRSKGQVRPRRGGGEEVVSTPQQPIRFPAALKKVHPRDWPLQYTIFLNLTHYPWPKSPPCANYSITFARPGALPPLALASFPSSGNTWVRYLVEGATGLFTGSLYDDTSLTKKGMYGEAIVYDSGMTILQKTHGYTTGDAMKLSHEERLPLNHLEQFGRKGVVVIRNPFKALISHRHLDTGGHTGYAPKAHFLGKGWAEFVHLKARLWRDFYVDWLTLSDDLHLTFYERVREDPVGEMRRILAHLDLPRDEGRLACVATHGDGLFKRRPSKNLPLTFDPFTRDLKEVVYGAVDDVEAALRERRRGRRTGQGGGGDGGEGLPLALYEFYDAQEAEEFRSRSRSRSKARSKGGEDDGVS
ncbi:uncharacterized protein [Macrobrachium rosenbergii]|uniref:uncharacterized protein n=1 Tax=Macrobrachium rosenbergii TaxID=79674 RepID=UPI0034D70D9E